MQTGKVVTMEPLHLHQLVLAGMESKGLPNRHSFCLEEVRAKDSNLKGTKTRVI